MNEQSAEIERLRAELKITDCSNPYGCRRQASFDAEIERLRGWLSAFANLRRIVGFVNDDMVEELARKALRGEPLPHHLKLYAAPDRQR